jgi:hypothetical protein
MSSGRIGDGKMGKRIRIWGDRWGIRMGWGWRRGLVCGGGDMVGEMDGAAFTID